MQPRRDSTSSRFSLSSTLVGSPVSNRQAQLPKKRINFTSALTSFGSLDLLLKKYRSSGYERRRNARNTLDITNHVSPYVSVNRPVKYERDVAMQNLQVLFASPIIALNWPQIRDFMEFFPLSILCALSFLVTMCKLTNNPRFSSKLDALFKSLELWLTWDLKASIANAIEVYWTIMDIIGCSEKPVKICSKDVSWSDTITRALVSDLEEFAHVFSDVAGENCVYFLYNTPTQMQKIVDFVQITISSIGSSHSRKLFRFLTKIAETKGVLPSLIDLWGVKRVGTNFVYGGGFADVWRGELNGQAVALKVLRIFSEADKQRVQLEFCKEALVWHKLEHPNVLPFLGISRDVCEGQLALVSYWMKNGNLVTFLSKNLGANRTVILRGIAHGMKYLHTLKPQVVHGDLRAANILMDEHFEPRITDFGLARVVDSQATHMAATSFKGRGTLRWQAPELLHSSRFTESGKVTTKSDVYAFSCLCLEVFTGDVPFTALRDGAVIMAVAVKDQRPSRPLGIAVRNGLDDRMWALIERCWQTNPADRPDMTWIALQLETLLMSGQKADAYATERPRLSVVI